MSTPVSRLANYGNDSIAHIPISSSEVDSEMNAWVAALNRKVVAKSTAPSSPTLGDTWVDTTSLIVKQYDGASWQDVGGITYSSVKTYALNDIVVSAGVIYKSLQAGNKNNTPASSPTYWQIVDQHVATAANALAGSVVQVVNTSESDAISIAGVIPVDDTKPQNTEGGEVMTCAITPFSATNILRIDVSVYLGTYANEFGPVALFQDSTADALAASAQYRDGNWGMREHFTHYMVAGTTSATTFKVRAGGSASGARINGDQSGNRRFGGAASTTITITEIKV